jgi:hypothetical protein
MSDRAKMSGAEPRKVLQTLIEQKTPAILSYLSRGKWHVTKVTITGLGAGKMTVQVENTGKPNPLNIRPDQPIGMSFKYDYGKVIFESKVIDLEPSQSTDSGGNIALAVPDRIELIERRSFFRVNVPKSLKVNVMLWHRNPASSDPQDNASRYAQGRLVDISAGGLQIVIDSEQGKNFRRGQFIGLRFTPMPYEIPLMFNAQIRNMLPTADNSADCMGLQIVGLEASPEGRETLKRLCDIVEKYYQMDQSKARQHSKVSSGQN